jgi:hypothetical protein
MAGYVLGHVQRHSDSSLDVTPYECPVKEPYHLPHQPRCETVMFDGARRRCLYLISLTEVSNCSDRQDITRACTAADGSPRYSAPVGILCSCARRNRAPGC